MAAELAQADLTRALEYFWHPVCTMTELRAAERGVLAVQLLGRRLVVADLPGEGIIALDDRCLHRSTKLSVGWAEPGGVRCAYHGWKWDGTGRCIEIPAMPDGPIPARARVGSYSTEVVYDLVWVRIDDRADTVVPACPSWDDPQFRALQGEPYTWPVAAARRVENFVDLSHFAWVHAGTLGRRDQPVPPLPSIERLGGELRFVYEPPEMETAATALFGYSAYRMPMPCTVNIDFTLDTGARRMLWMTASPIDERTCRAFWVLARSDAWDEPDEAHFAFQQVVLDEDAPVVLGQFPGELPLDHTTELSVRTDRVSIEYRRWIRELAEAALEGPERLGAVVRREVAAQTA